ncbi:hypothetical protein IQ264_01390 [Phormidium sp. LEGE 05292]|uniref:hypothetical protein n=1 Tax=[Phormidium] sp. LEGE 05292 TaxID=767427 RepID=UPI00187EA309|nr:hypothetical protein [Phormidium sp. LEGE 05292]MBE9224127.1 hypothetical protein [Phormidium sp. LEGE 05292]
MNQLFNLNTTDQNPNSLLEMTDEEIQSLEVLDVVAVFGASLPQPELVKPHLFNLGDIVTQGQHYGVVTSLTETDRPITITWDGRSDSEADAFAYTLDEIRFFQISIVSQFVPLKTLLELPANTTMQFGNAKLVKLNQTRVFLLEEVTEHHLIIRSLDERFRFTRQLFPGRLFACAVDIPILDRPETASPLTLLELKTRLRVHLALAMPNNLELITTAKKQQIFQELRCLLAEERYDDFHLNAAWEELWQQQLKSLVQDRDFHGIYLGSRILRQRSGIKIFGTIVELNIELLRPFQIQWDSGEVQIYSLTELRCLGITQIEPIAKLSPNVAYQVSGDGSYFKAWIGFRTKALAKAWWRFIKKQVGYLSHLQDCYTPELRHTDKRYEYGVEKYRQKTLAKRIEALQKVAELNLEQIP